jgi:hypothetical protein
MFSFLFGVWLGWYIESIQLKIVAFVEKVRSWLS